MVIELAWRLYFVNYLTDGDDKRRKVEKREICDLRCVGDVGTVRESSGCGLRVAGCGFEKRQSMRESLREEEEKIKGIL